MTTTDTTGSRSPSSEIGMSLLWLTVATLGLLLLVEMARAWGCWLSVIAIVIFAYPLWLARREGFLFNRRLLLSGITIEDSVYPAIPGQKYNIQKQQLTDRSRVLHLIFTPHVIINNNITSNSFNNYFGNE